MGLTMANISKMKRKDCHKNTNMKLCSINIDGLSSKSRFMLDKYIYDESIDILCVQETGQHDIEKIKLTNMKTILDTNGSRNRGAAIFVHDSISCVSLPEISQKST